jgi:hypothetical protein
LFVKYFVELSLSSEKFNGTDTSVKLLFDDVLFYVVPPILFSSSFFSRTVRPSYQRFSKESTFSFRLAIGPATISLLHQPENIGVRMDMKTDAPGPLIFLAKCFPQLGYELEVVLPVNGMPTTFGLGTVQTAVEKGHLCLHRSNQGMDAARAPFNLPDPPRPSFLMRVATASMNSKVICATLLIGQC